jgi:small-conductance mechanosensitive channel
MKGSIRRPRPKRAGIRLGDPPPALVIAAVLLTSFLFAGPELRAQEATPPAEAGAEQAEPEAPTPAEAVRASEVASKAETTIARLREIRSGLGPNPDIVLINEELPGTTETIDQLQAEVGDRDLSQLNQAYLEDLQRRWSRQRTLLGKWKKVLEDRAKELGEWKTELEGFREEWEVVHDVLESSEEVPEALIARTDAVLADIDNLQTELNEVRAPVLTLQDRNLDEQNLVSERIAAIDAALVAARGRLFFRQEPPLWAEITSPSSEMPLGEQIRSIWTKNLADLQEFREDYRVRVNLHFVGFLVLAIMMIVLRRRATWIHEDDPDLKAAAHILGRPFSSALLIALLQVIWMYPDAPRAVGQLAFTLALIPVLRLLPGLVHPEMRFVIYAFGGLFFVARLADLSVHQPLLRRLLMLVLDLGALAALVWLVRPGGLATRVGQTRWWKVGIGLGRVAVFLMAVAAIANIVGNTLLADLLAVGTMRSIYFGGIVFVATLTLVGLVTAILRTRAAQWSRGIRTHTEVVKRRIGTAIRVIGVGLWIWGVLTLFQIWDPLVDDSLRMLEAPWTIGTFSISIADILAFVIAIWVSVKISQFTRFVLEQDVMPHLDLPRGVAPNISMLVHYSILAIGFLIAIAAAGFELDRLTLIVGALGVGIGFGLQNLVNNFVSGLILVFERPIKIGDTIDIGTLRGEVRRIGIRSSTVRTYDGAEVIVPNGNLISSEVINWTLSDRMRRIEVAIGVKYGTDPQTVLDILTRVARDHEDVLDYPEPHALFRTHGESSLDFVVRFWTRRFDDWLRIQSDVTVAVNAALKEANIEIPFPQRDLHLRSVDPSTGLVGPEREPALESSRPRDESSD